jgi:hypothetical protein
MMNPNDSAARTEVGPHNTIEKEHEEEMAEARWRKLACF